MFFNQSKLSLLAVSAAATAACNGTRINLLQQKEAVAMSTGNDVCLLPY